MFDEISMKTIKHNTQYLCTPLVYIRNLSLTTGIVPDNIKIARKVDAYTTGRKRCNLCNNGKLFIMKTNSANQLNKRNEIFSMCRHQERFIGRNFERARKKSRKTTNVQNAPTNNNYS